MWLSPAPCPAVPQDRSDHEVEKVKGTLILCYGHVAARAPRELVLARAESDILRNMFQCFSTKVGPWMGIGGGRQRHVVTF